MSSTNGMLEATLLKKKFYPHGFGILSFFFGIATGLLISAYLAFYITKTPVPFADKLDGYNKTKSIIKLSETDDDVIVKIAPSDMSIFLPDSKENSVEPDSETLPDRVEKVIQTSKLEKEPNSTIEEDKSFYLQVGAFREVKEADRMRAKLAFLGFEAAIYKKNKKGNLFYRVRLGPFNSSEELNNVKRRLSDSQIKSHAVLVNR
ncbi:SPOR domain-containing protein [Betaproteobacteria bacterium]|nr:SPOR domain-containing protein [Betaproteobacteria bacterium]